MAKIMSTVFKCIICSEFESAKKKVLNAINRYFMSQMLQTCN